MNQLTISEFADKISAILPQVMKEFAHRQQNELFKGKISLPQCLVIDFLSRQGSSKMSDLARFMHVTTAAMTGIIERLVQQGYVLRSYDPADRRIIRIKLTAKGSESSSKIIRQRRQMIIDIFGRLSSFDRGEYLRILTQIRDSLAEKEE